MPNEQKDGLDRRDFMMAAIGLVGASGTLASFVGTANAQDTKAPPVGPASGDRKSTRLNSSHSGESRMPSSA